MIEAYAKDAMFSSEVDLKIKQDSLPLSFGFGDGRGGRGLGFKIQSCSEFC